MRYSFKFVKDLATLKGHKLTRHQLLGNRANYYYEFTLDGIIYKNLRDVIKELDKVMG